MKVPRGMYIQRMPKKQHTFLRPVKLENTFPRCKVKVPPGKNTRSNFVGHMKTIPLTWFCFLMGGIKKDVPSSTLKKMDGFDF